MLLWNVVDIHSGANQSIVSFFFSFSCSFLSFTFSCLLSLLLLHKKIAFIRFGRRSLFNSGVRVNTQTKCQRQTNDDKNENDFDHIVLVYILLCEIVARRNEELSARSSYAQCHCSRLLCHFFAVFFLFLRFFFIFIFFCVVRFLHLFWCFSYPEKNWIKRPAIRLVDWRQTDYDTKRKKNKNKKWKRTWKTREKNEKNKHFSAFIIEQQFQRCWQSRHKHHSTWYDQLLNSTSFVIFVRPSTS